MVKVTEGYFECISCNINTLTHNRMCPCPRGSCEAKLKGKIVRTTEIIRDK